MRGIKALVRAFISNFSIKKFAMLIRLYIFDYFDTDKEKRLDKNGKSKLKELQDKLSKIIEIKKVYFNTCGVVLCFKSID